MRAYTPSALAKEAVKAKLELDSSNPKFELNSSNPIQSEIGPPILIQSEIGPPIPI